MQVPNMKGAESLSISEIAAQLWRLQKLAEEGHLHQEDLEGITTSLPAFLTIRSQLSAVDWTVCCVPQAFIRQQHASHNARHCYEYHTPGMMCHHS